MRNLPSNDEEYDSLLERIVKGAEYLENPLIKPADYEKGMKLYDELCAAAIEYRKGLNFRGEDGKRNHSTGKAIA